MSVSISIDKVTKKYGDVTVLNNLSLDIKPGELFTLLGPSGCGKTTLLRMVIGFNTIDGGEIKVDNALVNNVPVNKRKMGMVFQNYAIFPHMSVKENIAFGLKVDKIEKDTLNEKIDEIMKIVRIEEHKSKKPEQLSGGQQQRVALARALVIHPKVLLMDEPLSNLDAKLRVEMRNAIKQIQQRIGITTLYVTHDQEEALAISDRIAVMYNGIIQQIGKPKEIYSRPNNLFVAQFIGTSNVIKGKFKMVGADIFLVCSDSNYKEKVNSLLLDVKHDQDVLIAVRPQDLIITDEPNAIPGIIESTMFLGINTHYFIKLDSDKTIEVIQDENKELIKEGTHVYLQMVVNKINIFDPDTEESLMRGGE